LNGRRDLAPAVVRAWREVRRIEYRRATGVEIEQRDALRCRLQQSAQIGDRSVDEVIDELRRDYANGSSLVERGSARVGDEGLGGVSTV